MSQMFHVVKCFSCDCFQAQQVKKVKKWTCKLCGEKQSLLEEFAGGSGADCRRHVQRLNAQRGAAWEEAHLRSLRKWREEQTGSEDRHHHQASSTRLSRWSKYVDPPEDVRCFRGNSRETKLDADGRHRSNADAMPRPPASSRPGVTSARPPLPASSVAPDDARPRPTSSTFDSGEDFDVDF
ncbi:MRN complex-interacting protein [Syngnathoides biaculeatus]|uniref:MRN complex-interacting protein n=1 Tax=Syngnathoides biaculeatus TaxID=300417 RepID=UPI002ADDFBA0|nr:MRN complex-interacting protein [Syngnathoides biaculeatus]